MRRRTARGFTLIELMIVITIIGLASAAAVLAVPDPRGRVRDEAARFAARVDAARDVAIIEGKPVSLWVTTGGYGFDERRGGRWVPMSDKPFLVEQWKEGTRVRLPNGEERARLTFDVTGFAEQGLSLSIERESSRVSATINASGRARISG